MNDKPRTADNEVSLHSFYGRDLADLFTRLSIKSDPEKIIQRLYDQTFYDTQQTTVSLTFLQPIYKTKYLINQFFSHIYVLNLDSRPDRWRHMQRELDRLGIVNYTRFSAVNGKQEPHLSEWNRYSKIPLTKFERTRYQRKGIASAGSWAILKSMYLMLREAQERRLDNFLVLQDDMLSHRDFHTNFESTVRSGTFPKSWKIFYLGATQHLWGHCTFDKSQKIYYANGTADGAFAVAFHHSIYQEMINEILEFDLPIDSGTLKTMQRRYPRETPIMFPNIIIADIRDSDLRGYRSLEQFSKKFRWNLPDYHVVDKIAET